MPILTTKVSGQVTINADSATATVAVYPEATSFPAGTVMWSVPSVSTGGGSGAFTVQAMPTSLSLGDVFIVQPSGLVQALKADGTPVWNASFGFNAGHALADPSGGIIGFDTASAPMTRIDSSGSPTWSIPPADYNYRAENIAIHPDGTIFILGRLKNPPDGASTLTYVIGINGLTGSEKFRVPVMTSEQVPNMVLEDVQPSTITIAPDGNAYLEHVVETGSRTQQNFDVSTIVDSTSTASLRIMKIASDGTYVDNEIQSWSSSYHEDDEFSDSGATEVATYSFSPAQLPEFSLKEIIPDNHGNLLASWSYWVPSWTQTCTTTGRNSQQQSTTCSGPVPGQDTQAHVSLLAGLNLENDFILSGVDYFTGPIVMGQLDTAFVTGAKSADSLNRIAAFNAVSGQPSWSTPGTADLIEPVAATADGGVAAVDTPNSGGNAILVRYDSTGSPIGDGIQVPGTPADSWSGGWYADGSAGASAILLPLAVEQSSMWAEPRGNPSSNNFAIAQCPCLSQSSDSGSQGAVTYSTSLETTTKISHSTDMHSVIEGSNQAMAQLLASSCPICQLVSPDCIITPGTQSTYLVLVGDPGLREHNAGALFSLAAQQRTNDLADQGHRVISCRVSSIQDFDSAIISHGFVDGGVVYFGHGGPGAATLADGGTATITALYVGEQSGADTNIGSYNVTLLSNVRTANSGSNILGANAAIEINGCSAGKDVMDYYVGAQISIAQLIANQTGRGVYAYKVGMYFSQQDRDNDQHYDGSTSPNPPATLPIYLVPVGPPGHKPTLAAFPAH